MKVKSKIFSILMISVLVILACFSFAGYSKAKESSAKVPKNAIRIQYVGNSCFYITFADGTRLVTDPYGSKYKSCFGDFPKLEADVITISHAHDDHTAGVEEISGDPQVINYDKLNETIKVGDVKITGYSSEHVANMGDNAIFVYKEKGYKIVHMGETDNIDSEEVKEAVKDADVILAYAGEYGTVKNADSFKTLEELGIKVLIPQHYSNIPDNIFYGEPTLDQIIKEVPEDLKVVKADELYVTKHLKKEFVAMERMK